ncbi:MAG: NTF2 fold immunity protein [Casimicrobium sp.]
MVKDSLNSPQSTLTSFMQAMLSWETKFHQLYNDDGMDKHEKTAARELAKIYDAFLTKKERKLGKLSSLDAGWPATFDPNAEVFGDVQLSDKSANIETTWTHPVDQSICDLNRYTLISINNKWFIDKKETWSKQKKMAKRSDLGIARYCSLYIVRTLQKVKRPQTHIR